LPIDDVADFSIDGEGTATMARIDIERLLAALPAKQAEAIRLTQIDGLSVKEAAAQSGQSEPSIKVGVYRGLHRLMNARQGKTK